jgi:hypothetical protein
MNAAEFISDAMLPKLFATWLIALVIAPCTAPFPTCDLARLLGHDQGQHGPVAPSGSVVLTNDDAMPSAVFVSSGGRVRPLPLSRTPLVESATPSSPATLILSVESAGGVKNLVALSTILRV